MTTPVVVALVIGLIGLAMLLRGGRSLLRTDFRYLSDPKEAKRSALVGALLGILILALSGCLVGLLAGLSRYVALEAGPTPAVTVAVEPQGGVAWRVSFPGHPPNLTMGPMILEGGWFSIVAEKVVWSGPLAWAGFQDALRPSAVLTAKRQEDITRPEAIVRHPISADNLFEAAAAGPLARIGLCRFGEIRTPWRPVKPGAREYLYTEAGAVEAVVEP